MTISADITSALLRDEIRLDPGHGRIVRPARLASLNGTWGATAQLVERFEFFV